MKAKILAAAGAAALTVQPQIAAAQACLSQPEIAAITVYAVPPVLAGVQAKCGAELRPDGFLAQEGPGLSSRYAALAPQNWQVARSALMKIAESAPSQTAEQRQIFSTLRQLPDQAVRPVLDALIVQKLTEAIQLSSCAQIERGISLLAPLDPAQTGAITAFVLSLVKPDEFPICDPAQP
ncbi:hypothetical protein [Altericroceibacterium xinjiangense]|uniref:hypothetical protein n=1 Tax=Altericroceibacterium xinjiangense TaxID=762261 RepID=UPI000F7D5BF5|nr:hypothetical protein [Altericroceibacterium xinjiangense]